MAAFIDPFDKLLNNISHDLDEQNLRSLVHICGEYIPGCRRDEIRHGLDVFRILKERNVIGSASRDKVANLFTIVSEIKPKRKDIIRKVRKYIEDTQPEYIVAIDLESSVDSESGPVLLRSGDTNSTYLLSRSHSPITTVNNCCAVNCCCCACNCYPQGITACLCVFLAIVFGFAAIIATLAWYGDIPKVTNILNNDPDIKNAGKYVVALICVIAVGFLVGGISIYVRNRRRRRYSILSDQDLSREYLSSSSVPGASPPLSRQCSNTSLPYIPNPGGRNHHRRDKRRRGESSAASSASISTMSSPASRFNHPGCVRSVSVQSDVVPDCACPQERPKDIVPDSACSSQQRLDDFKVERLEDISDQDSVSGFTNDAEGYNSDAEYDGISLFGHAHSVDTISDPGYCFKDARKIN